MNPNTSEILSKGTKSNYRRSMNQSIIKAWLSVLTLTGFFFQILHENACYLIQILLIKSLTRQRFIVFFKLSLIKFYSDEREFQNYFQ